MKEQRKTYLMPTMSIVELKMEGVLTAVSQTAGDGPFDPSYDNPFDDSQDWD